MNPLLGDNTPIASSSWDVPQSHVPKEAIVCAAGGGLRVSRFLRVYAQSWLREGAY